MLAAIGDPCWVLTLGRRSSMPRVQCRVRTLGRNGSLDSFSQIIGHPKRVRLGRPVRPRPRNTRHTSRHRIMLAAIGDPCWVLTLGRRSSMPRVLCRVRTLGRNGSLDSFSQIIGHAGLVRRVRLGGPVRPGPRRTPDTLRQLLAIVLTPYTLRQLLAVVLISHEVNPLSGARAANANRAL
jgi:hypothetical protein